MRNRLGISISVLVILVTIDQGSSVRLMKRGLFGNLFTSKACIKNGDKILSLDDVCCEGYNLTSDSRCVAVCDPHCGPGECVAPGVCNCLSTFTPDLSGTCVPSCPRGCLNGRCLPNGECECNPGYQLSRNRQFCQPICSNGCSMNMNCTSPEICSCPRGFDPNLDEGGSCKPVCKQNCLGGECVSPNVCFCYPGFRLRDGVCQAECKRGCRNGKCVFRDVCICDPGYTFNTVTETCDPVCTECEHGNCVAPDVCQCEQGYSRRGKRCHPYCLNDCSNGYCIAPAQCICRDGYGKDPNGVCSPLECRTRFTEKQCTIYYTTLQGGVSK